MTCSPRTGTSTNGAASDTHDLPVRGSKKQSLADGSYPFAFGLISYHIISYHILVFHLQQHGSGRTVPCSDAFLNSSAAFSYDHGTPSPSKYITLRLYWASAAPSSANSEKIRDASERICPHLFRRGMHMPYRTLPSVIVHKPSSPMQDTRTEHPENVRGCVPPTSSVYTHKSIEWPEVIL